MSRAASRGSLAACALASQPPEPASSFTASQPPTSLSFPSFALFVPLPEVSFTFSHTHPNGVIEHLMLGHGAVDIQVYLSHSCIHCQLACSCGLGRAQQLTDLQEEQKRALHRVLEPESCRNCRDDSRQRIIAFGQWPQVAALCALAL